MSVAKIAVALAGTLMVAATAEAQLAPPYLEYAAKFTCGIESAKEADDVVSGVCASSINIHNPQSQIAVPFVKKIVVANREDAAIGRIVVLRDVLKPDQADRVDCTFIAKALDQATTAYVEGFVVLEVPRVAATSVAPTVQPVLDVVGKYTARPLAGNVSTESVVQIDGKSITH